jgi:hypothetical protein
MITDDFANHFVKLDRWHIVTPGEQIAWQRVERLLEHRRRNVLRCRELVDVVPLPRETHPALDRETMPGNAFRINGDHPNVSGGHAVFLEDLAAAKVIEECRVGTQDEARGARRDRQYLAATAMAALSRAQPEYPEARPWPAPPASAPKSPSLRSRVPSRSMTTSRKTRSRHYSRPSTTWSRTLRPAISASMSLTVTSAPAEHSPHHPGQNPRIADLHQGNRSE